MSGAKFTIDWPEDQWQRILEAGTAAFRRAAELFVTDFWGNLREMAPVDHGRLAGAFQLQKNGDWSWTITNGVEYAMAVWKGTAPHTIVPRNAKALFWPGADHPVMRVNHPGTKPNPFVEDAWSRSEGRAEDFVTMAIAEQGA